MGTAKAMTPHRFEELQALFSDSRWFKEDEGQALLDEIDRAWSEIERLKTDHARANTRLGILGAAAANLCAMATDQQGIWTLALTRHVDALRATLASTTESQPVLTEGATAVDIRDTRDRWEALARSAPFTHRSYVENVLYPMADEIARLRAVLGETGVSSATPGPVAP